LNYGSSEAATIALTIRFDNAILDKGPAEAIPTNYGYSFGRTVFGAITGAG
jgi:hypothetical protein